MPASAFVQSQLVVAGLDLFTALQFVGRVEIGEGYRFRFTMDDTVLTALAVEAQFPQTSNIYQADYTHTIPIERGDLVKMLKRAIKNADLDRSCTTRFIFSKGKLRIECGNVPDGITVNDSIPINYNDDDFMIGWNVKYMLEGLEHAPADELKINLVDPQQPAKLECGNWDYVIMPIRL